MSAQNNTPTRWIGWVYFAGYMMVLLGILQGIAGLAGIFKSSFYVVNQGHLLVFNYIAWGWIDLVLGIIIFMAGLEVMRGALWARIAGVFLAGLSLIVNMGFLNAYPLWSILMIVIDVFVIHALVVHGDELRE